MKNSKNILIITLVIILLITATVILKAGHQIDNFGKNITMLGEKEGDFNGDEIADKLFVLKLNKNSVINKKLLILNPRAFPNSLPYSITDAKIVLGIIHGANKNNRHNNIFLLYSEYLSTSIWKQTDSDSPLTVYETTNNETSLKWQKGIKPKPIWVLKKGSNLAVNRVKYSSWLKEFPALKGDAIIMGTEAGIDILLYWNGKTYEIHWPMEEY